MPWLEIQRRTTPFRFVTIQDLKKLLLISHSHVHVRARGDPRYRRQ
jgi:hypothetical protein